MKAKRIELPDLIVKSFITELSTADQKVIQGGNEGGAMGTTEVPVYC